MKTFLEIDEAQLRDALVILDVDGTITHDKHTVVDRSIEEKIRRIASHSHVYLASNGELERTKRLAEVLGVRVLESTHRKPNRRVMESVTHEASRRIVIGDKVLTDGLLAVNIGATYIPVHKMRHNTDSFFVRLAYAIDDFAGMLMRSIFPLLSYLALMRPGQWVKNGLVFAPAFFAADLSLGTLTLSAWAGLAFCTAASAVYVYNDIKDVDQDRKHPIKRYRPIAAGTVSVRGAYMLLALLVAAAAAISAYVPLLGIVVLSYLAGNTAYTLVLKRVAVLDIVAVALFYVLRVIAGGIAAAIYVSPWIILCVFFGALFLVVGKRRAEFARGSRRSVLDMYSQKSLDIMLGLSATLAVTSYGVYSVLGAPSPLAVYSTFFVAAAIGRLLNMMYLSDSGAEYPESLVFKDRWVFCLALVWLLYEYLINHIDWYR
jgi:decaprenyl-phosphate phosphoribosyltransferase